MLFRTQKGELSVRLRELRLLVKSLRPLPDKFHGLEDRELRYRQRYVDLIMNEETRQAFAIRSRAVAAMRAFMVEQGFLEVETPMLQVIPGGAAAKPFVTHHNALDIDMFLRIAPELFLKRLVVGGFERVFEINRNFRNEGLSPRHNPEFTMMEFYAAYHEVRWMMDFTEQLLRETAVRATGSAVLAYQGQTIDLGRPFARLTIVEAIRSTRRSTPRRSSADRDFLHRELRGMGSTHAEEAGLGALQLALFEEVAEAKLAQPTYIVDYPVEVSPLARASDARPEDHRAVRAVHRRPRDGQRFLRAERPRGPGRALHGAGQGARRRRRGGDVLRRRLHPRARVRHAAGRRLRRRRRPLHHAAGRCGEHPRRDPVSAHAAGGARRHDRRDRGCARCRHGC
jgi:lysyl-tRNA synthetase, class II